MKCVWVSRDKKSPRLESQGLEINMFTDSSLREYLCKIRQKDGENECLD